MVSVNSLHPVPAGVSLPAGASDDETKPGWPDSPWQTYLATAATLTPHLNDWTQAYWGKPTPWQLMAVTSQTLSFWRRGTYLTQEVPLSEEATLQLRLSSDAFYPLLAMALGTRPDESEAVQRAPSPLETLLLDRFARHLGQLALEHLIDPEGLETQEPDTPTVHLVWLMQGPQPLRDPETGETLTGKLILSLPASALRYHETVAGRYSQWLDQELMAGQATVILTAGSGRLTLGDLQQLEEEDIILLDQSHREYLGFRLPNRDDRVGFPIRSAGPPLPVQPSDHDFDEEPGSSGMSMSSFSTVAGPSSASPGGSVWDHLQIDVHAEFAPTRVPLTQLKQMSEGLVVEVGDLLHNEIHLMANGKVLAQGQLVIVGDKFGVLITRMSGPANPEPATLELPAVAAGHGLSPTTAMGVAVPSVDGVDQSLVSQAHQLGLDVHQVAEMAQQQGMDPEDAMRQAIAYQQSQLGPPVNPDEEVARANAMMEEVDRVLSENFDEE